MDWIERNNVSLRYDYRPGEGPTCATRAGKRSRYYICDPANGELVRRISAPEVEAVAVPASETPLHRTWTTLFWSRLS